MKKSFKIIICITLQTLFHKTKITTHEVLDVFMVDSHKVHFIN